MWVIFDHIPSSVSLSLSFRLVHTVRNAHSKQRERGAHIFLFVTKIWCSGSSVDSTTPSFSFGRPSRSPSIRPSVPSHPFFCYSLFFFSPSYLLLPPPPPPPPPLPFPCLKNSRFSFSSVCFLSPSFKKFVPAIHHHPPSEVRLVSWKLDQQ
jgi:hypothetical protein